MALSALCPDVVVSAELPVVQWEALRDQKKIGEGGGEPTKRILIDFLQQGRLLSCLVQSWKTELLQ